MTNPERRGRTARTAAAGTDGPQPPRRATDAELDHAATVLRLLADRTRLGALALLEVREHSVGELADALGRAVPAMSQHLARLREAGLVTSRRVGTTIYYGQPDEHVAELVRQSLRLAEHAVHEVPPHHRPACANGSGEIPGSTS